MPNFNTNSHKKAPRSDLLEELVTLTHCEFISNLPQRKPEIFQAVLHLNAEDFTLKAWQSAILYLGNGSANAKTQHQGRSALLWALQQEI